MRKLVRLLLLSTFIFSLILMSAGIASAQDDEEDELTADDYYDLGYTAYLDGDYETAIDGFTNAIELDSALASAYFYRAISNYNLGNGTENMIADIDSAIENEFFDIAWAYNIRGLTNARMGDYEQAIIDYTEALNLSSTYRAVYTNRSIAYQNLGEWASAAQDSKSALELDPDDVGAYNSLAWAYVQIGRYEDALNYVLVEMDRNPGLGYVTDTLGWAYLGLGRYFDAIEAFEEAIDLGEDYSYYGLAVAYDRLGANDSAIDYMQTYIDIFGDDAEQGALDLLAEWQDE